MIEVMSLEWSKEGALDIKDRRNGQNDLKYARGKGGNEWKYDLFQLIELTEYRQF